MCAPILAVRSRAANAAQRIGGAITIDRELLINSGSPGSAQEVAETILAAMGATDRQIRGAVYCNAAAEQAAFQVPPDCDYHGVAAGQGLPAWVRVYEVTGSVAAQVVADNADQPAAAEFIAALGSGQFGHLARIVSDTDQKTLATIARGIEELVGLGWKVYDRGR